jgi:transcription initiation factor TFIID subunit 2
MQGVSDQSPEDKDILEDAKKEIVRYKEMDRLVPSSHNVVTVAILKVCSSLQAQSVVLIVVLVAFASVACDAGRQRPGRVLVIYQASDINGRFDWLTCSYIIYREGNYVAVRIAAFEGLLLTRWFSAGILRYLLVTLQHDSSRIVRRHVARAMLESIMLQLALGDIKSSKEESVLVEEDGSALDKANTAAKKSEVNGLIKTLRKDREFGKSDAFRELIAPLLL